VFVLVAVFAVSYIGYCDEGGETPKAAVRGMMEAVKAGDYEKAIGYMDLEGICTAIKKQMDEQKDRGGETSSFFISVMIFIIILVIILIIILIILRKRSNDKQIDSEMIMETTPLNDNIEE